MKLALIALGLTVAATAQAAETATQLQPAEHLAPPAGSLPCNIPGHPSAVCFWQEPGARECFPGPIVSKTDGFPARHYFSGNTVCWGGDQRYFVVVDP